MLRMVGVVLIVLGLVVLALVPVVRRRMDGRGDTRNGVRTYGNAVTGVLILGFGVAFAAGFH